MKVMILPPVPGTTATYRKIEKSGKMYRFDWVSKLPDNSMAIISLPKGGKLENIRRSVRKANTTGRVLSTSIVDNQLFVW